MEIRLSDDGMIAHKESDGESDISGRARNWIIDYVPLGDYDVWEGFPLYDEEVRDWKALPETTALVNHIVRSTT